MTGVHSLVRVGLRTSKWLLPWISVLLVSATAAYAMNGALTGGRVSPAWWPAGPLAPTAAAARANETMASEHVVLELRGACSSLFGSYNFWLFDKDSQGPCGLSAADAADPPPGD